MAALGRRAGAESVSGRPAGRVWGGGGDGGVDVGGRMIRTTTEHPFWVLERGWVEAGALKAGDLLCSHDGAMRMVERVEQTQEVTTVYNVAVEDFHTYFVGSPEWAVP